MAQQKVWTTQMVEEVKESLRYGNITDLSCFHERDVELKGGNILFKLSQQEYEEFELCSTDINYFVQKYCRFMTDSGRTTVTLRKYQTDVLDVLGEEHYIPSLDEMGPKVRNFILMASRQTGKCLIFNELEVNKHNKSFKTPIEFLYYQHKKNLTFLDKIKFKLFIFYNIIDKW